MNIVLDEGGPRWWLRPEDARVLAVLLATAVLGARALLRARAAGALAALEDALELVFQLVQAAPQVGVFRLEVSDFRLLFGDPIQKLLPIVHTGRILVND
jgi:hypothetical protein